jgi:Lar family restriction alleviation protein
MTNDRDGREGLKPCPFCGSEKIELSPRSLGVFAVVTCRSCACYGQPTAEDSEAIAAWNQRPAPEGRVVWEGEGEIDSRGYVANAGHSNLRIGMEHGNKRVKVVIMELED